MRRATPILLAVGLLCLWTIFFMAGRASGGLWGNRCSCSESTRTLSVVTSCPSPNPTQLSMPLSTRHCGPESSSSAISRSRMKL